MSFVKIHINLVHLGVNVLDEDNNEFKRLRQLGYSESDAMKALEITEVPLTGPEQYEVFTGKTKIVTTFCYSYTTKLLPTTSKLLPVPINVAV